MSVVIRLATVGRKGERRFRVVVKEKRSRRDGKAIEFLGWYEKNINGEKKVINTERVKYWLSQGAKASPTVDKILSIK
ncbi:30S ribosomal protein S16 [Candidatus Levyibacteriota bacterium]|nr:30S ribosomal protein S16 [Candidatus Levybacteria bacterium]MSU26174.1 30S ribosomal protein S16 [Candidatus Levybacteria bacterium]GDX62132.1 30S ribosomal protein S16 [Candidatus Levybacteria bacterium]